MKTVSLSRASIRRKLGLFKVGVLVGCYTLSEAWSGVNWADLMAAQGAFGTDFYDRSTRLSSIKHKKTR